jgi:hypothetical protein
VSLEWVIQLVAVAVAVVSMRGVSFLFVGAMHVSVPCVEFSERVLYHIILPTYFSARGSLTLRERIGSSR